MAVSPDIFVYYDMKGNQPTFTNIPVGRYLLVANGYVNWEGGDINNYHGIAGVKNIITERNMYERTGGAGSLTILILSATDANNSFWSKSNGHTVLFSF